MDATPIWLMRQAGRYLPEYRALRKRHSILELASTPELAVEVAMQPLRRFNLDAAILFADIVLPLRPMGVGLDLVDNVGPVIASPIREARQVEALQPVHSPSDLGFVMEAVRSLKVRLAGERALIGFSGAPFTLASYLIEGRPSREFVETKRLMHGQPATWSLLMEKLTDVVADYLEAQTQAGADAVQLFDSWAGHLSPSDYRRFVRPYTERILARLASCGAPRIHFATPTAGLLEEMAGLDAEVIGLDWRVSIAQARIALGDVAVQGNLDPAILAASAAETENAARRILAEATGVPGHIFNLGHGVLPSTPPEHIERLVQAVHSSSSRHPLEATA